MLVTVNQGCMQPWTTDHAWTSAQRVVDGHPVKPRIQDLPAKTRVILPFGVVNLCCLNPISEKVTFGAVNLCKIVRKHSSALYAKHT